MDDYLLTNENGIIPYAERLLREDSQNKSKETLPFLPEYLKKCIGRWIRVEHLLGNELVTHIGQLISTGMDFIVLKLDSDAVITVVCNIKDIRFITIIYDKNIKLLK